MIRTRVGYAGGDTTSPTYHDLANHSETTQIDFDPTRITYAQLLEIFWDSHSATVETTNTQYKSIVFFHDEEQKRLAEQVKQAREQRTGRTLYTELRPFTAFYRAEDYHQKYTLRSHADLLGELSAIYPDAKDLTDSTAAARANGILAGQGKAGELAAELDQYGLSSRAQDKLREYLIE